MSDPDLVEVRKWLDAQRSLIDDDRVKEKIGLNVFEIQTCIGKLELALKNGPPAAAALETIYLFSALLTHIGVPEIGAAIISGRQSDNRVGKYKIPPEEAVDLVDTAMDAHGLAYYPASEYVGLNYTDQVTGELKRVSGKAVRSSYESMKPRPPKTK